MLKKNFFKSKRIKFITLFGSIILTELIWICWRLASIVYWFKLIFNKIKSCPDNFFVSKEKCFSLNVLTIFKIKWSISSLALIIFTKNKHILN